MHPPTTFFEKTLWGFLFLMCACVHVCVILHWDPCLTMNSDAARDLRVDFLKLVPSRENQFARGQKAIWTHLNALVACQTTCALRTYFFLMFTWDLPHNDLRPVWLRLSCWIETRNSCTGTVHVNDDKSLTRSRNFTPGTTNKGRDVCVVIPS